MRWRPMLDETLARLEGAGWLTLHRYDAPPVEPAFVAEALARCPDLDGDILEFYAQNDGAQLIVGRPLRAQIHYSAPGLIRRRAAKTGGPFLVPGEVHMDNIAGPVLSQEFGDQVRSIEILPFDVVMDERTESFAFREGKNVIRGAARLGYSELFGITRSEEIRRWRQPKPAPGRPRGEARRGYRDHDAEVYQACLSARERELKRSWWALRAEDHGAALRWPGQLLSWGEMLAQCLRYLETGE